MSNGTSIHIDKQKRYCEQCYQRRLKYNEKSELQRKEKGICRQCGKQSINYSRSQLHCNKCLDKRNDGKKYNYINSLRLFVLVIELNKVEKHLVSIKFFIFCTSASITTLKINSFAFIYKSNWIKPNGIAKISGMEFLITPIYCDARNKLLCPSSNKKGHQALPELVPGG